MSTTLLQNTSLGASSGATSSNTRALAMTNSSGEVSKTIRWIGTGLTVLVLLALAADITFKLIQSPQAVQGTVQLGYPASTVVVIGVLQLICFVLYVIPATAPLGAVLFTAYFGGAVATHIRIGNPLLTHILSGVYVTAILWFGLYTRDPRVRALFGRRNAR